MCVGPSCLLLRENSVPAVAKEMLTGPLIHCLFSSSNRPSRAQKEEEMAAVDREGQQLTLESSLVIVSLGPLY